MKPKVFDIQCAQTYAAIISTVWHTIIRIWNSATFQGFSKTSTTVFKDHRGPYSSLTVCV